MAIQTRNVPSGSRMQSTRESVPVHAPRPGLFIKTIVPSGVVSHVHPCDLLPPAVLRRYVPTAVGADSLLAPDQYDDQPLPPRVSHQLEDRQFRRRVSYMQLVKSLETSLELHLLDPATTSLVNVLTLPTFTRVRGLASLPLPGGEGDVLIVLSQAGKVSFVVFDPLADALVCVESAFLHGPPTPLLEISPRRDPRLICAHPYRPLVALASLESVISVFPVLFLPKQVGAGHAVTVPIDGVVISMDFIEGGTEEHGKSFLLALVQKDAKQYIAILRVRTHSDAAGGGLLVHVAGYMVTCASRHDDTMVARVQSKLTGEPVKPPRVATDIAHIPGCPYLFCVFMEGRVVVADARTALVDALYGRGRLAGSAHGPKPLHYHLHRPAMAVQLHSIEKDYASHQSSDQLGSFPREERLSTEQAREAATSTTPALSTTADAHSMLPSVNADPTSAGDNIEAEETELAASSHAGEANAGADSRNGEHPLESSHAVSVDGQAGASSSAIAPFSSETAQGYGASSSELYGQEASASGPNDTIDDVDMSQAESGSSQVIGSGDFADGLDDNDGAASAETPVGSVEQTSHDYSDVALLSSGSPLGDPQNAAPVRIDSERVRSSGHASGEQFSTGYDQFMSYMYVPPNIALDVGEEREGNVSSFTYAGLHFGGERLRERVHGEGHANLQTHVTSNSGAMYFVTESKKMYALRWAGERRGGGVSSFEIPDAHPMALPQNARKTDSGASGAKLHAGISLGAPSPRLFFSLDVLGDVGPAHALAALGKDVVFVANDGADGCLLKVRIPAKQVNSMGMSGLHIGSRLGYSLELCQVFLNLSPISDFVLHSRLCKLLSHRRRCERALRVQAGGKSTRTNLQTMTATAGKESVSAFEARQAAGSSVQRLNKRGRSDAGPRGHVIRRAHEPGRLVAGEDPFQGYPANDRTGPSRPPLIVACCGVGTTGTLRIVRPGVPVSVLSTSSAVFPGCNGMWSIPAVRNTAHHGFLIITFTQSSGVFVPAPGSWRFAHRGSLVERSFGVKLLDASQASGMLLNCRTLTSGCLADGVLVQVHASGIRCIVLAKASAVSKELKDVGGWVRGSMAHRVVDWAPPPGTLISAGVVGYDRIVVATSCGDSPRLLHLGLAKDNVSEEHRVQVLSSACLGAEATCLTWTKRTVSGGVHGPGWIPAVVVATYASTLEVHEVVEQQVGVVCKVDIPSWCDCLPRQNDESSYKSAAEVRGGEPRLYMDCDRSQGHGIDHRRGFGESVLPVRVRGQEHVFVGTRDGHILQYRLNPRSVTRQDTPALELVGCRNIGQRPVVLVSVNVSWGTCLLAQGDALWLGRIMQDGVSWMPLGIEGTCAIAPLAIPHAERCVAMVGSDDRLRICGIRKCQPVSVQSIFVGDTPRRCVALDSNADQIAVVTSRDEVLEPNLMHSKLDETKSAWRRFAVGDPSITPRRDHVRGCRPRAILGSPYGEAFEVERDSAENGALKTGRNCDSELRIYRSMDGAVLCKASLLPREIVHVLNKLSRFVAIGTSFDIRKAIAKSEPIPERGRLLLYSVVPDTTSVDGGRNPSRSARSAMSNRALNTVWHDEPNCSLSMSCEVILPGPILAGAVNEAEDMLVVSSGEQVFVFGLSGTRSALFEIARTSMRALVVSVAIRGGVISVADVKDSVSFFRLNTTSHRLERNRVDYCKRTVSDAVLVDEHTALVSDKLGNMFSLAYDERDAEALPKCTKPTDVDGIAARTLPSVESPREQTSEEIGDHFGVAPARGNVSSNASEADLIAGEGLDGFEDASEGSPESDMEDEAQEGDGVYDSNVGISPNADGVAVPDAEDIREQNDDNPLETVQLMADSDSSIPDAEENLEFTQIGDPHAQGTNPPYEPVQRNLVSDHAFHLNDVALRLQLGSFSHVEPPASEESKATMSWRGGRNSSFWTSKRTCVIAGTVSGAFIAAVPVDRAELTVLHNVSRELVQGQQREILGTYLGLEHKRFRESFGGEAKGCVDGDVLALYPRLPLEQRLQVASAAGYAGVNNAHRICALIHRLCDRAL